MYDCQKLSVNKRASAWTLLSVVFILSAFAANVRAADTKHLLNTIQNRHQAVHTQVSPAVVAVQSPGDRNGSGFYGTGVVVSPQGLILTSSTVVNSLTRTVQIFFPDGRIMDAKVLGRDVETESCVLQAVLPPDEVRDLPYLELADSSKAFVGELAYTAGNPFHTISRDGQVAWSCGTISGQYNLVSADEQARYSGLVLETDAAVNPGSDGGPLIDANGRLLGILSLAFCESRWLGTAVPIHLIKKGLADPLKNLPLVETKAVLKKEDTEGVQAATAIPEGLRIAARPAIAATVKLFVKRGERPRPEYVNRGAPNRRIKQRPDAPCSGVCIDPDGFILTSAFNIDGEVTSIEAMFQDGTILPAKILGRNLGLDTAVLKVEPPAGKTLKSIPLTSDPDLRIGRSVAVLGSSEDGVQPTTTVGIVSALARLEGTAVQTDALINYGNSGGPVIDLRGRMVGLAAHVRLHTDWSQQNSGVGFFSQSDKIIASLADLKAGRDIKAPPRAFLGVSPADGATEIRGVKLDEVVANSAAASAKLKTGDIIVAVDGMDTHSWPALVRVLKAHQPGDMIEITFTRGTVTTRAQTILTARKDPR